MKKRKKASKQEIDLEAGWKGFWNRKQAFPDFPKVGKSPNLFPEFELED
jgi:hypothetical protein